MRDPWNLRPIMTPKRLQWLRAVSVNPYTQPPKGSRAVWETRRLGWVGLLISLADPPETMAESAFDAEYPPDSEARRLVMERRRPYYVGYFLTDEGLAQMRKALNNQD